MRLYEMLLLLSNVCLLLIMIFTNKNKRVSLVVTSVISTDFLIVHWMTEGFRVQLLLLYCITLLLLFISGYNYIKVPVYRTKSRLWLNFKHIFIAVVLFITAALMYAFPVFELPKPKGEYKVGTQTFHFIDSNRDEIFDDNIHDKRELMVQVWYPAQNIKGTPAPFIADRLLLNEEPLSKTLGLPTMIMEYLKYIPSNSYKAADISIASSTYPLVILNHGYKSSRIYHTSQAEYLASHGYIVSAIDHTYSTFATVFPGGRFTTMKTDEYLIRETEYRDNVGEVWTDDVAFVLDQFERINIGQIPTIFENKLDLNHIGVFGHSFGGATAYDSSYDTRITAGINLDGGLYRYHDTVGVTKPFMFMYSESTFEKFDKVRQNYVYTDEELAKIGATREEIDKETIDNKIEIEHIKKAAQSGGQVVYIEGTKHYNFADVQFLTPILKHIGMLGKIDTKRASSIVNAYTLDFFDKYLKNKGGNLVEGPSSEYPEVKFATEQFAEGSE